MRHLFTCAIAGLVLGTTLACSGLGGPAEPVTWFTTEVDYMDRVGETIKVECPPNGSAHTVHGTRIYGAASSICTAAVHAGKITLKQGGAVTFHMKGEHEGFKGSKRNGIKSSDYLAYNYSFTF